MRRRQSRRVRVRRTMTAVAILTAVFVAGCAPGANQNAQSDPDRAAEAKQAAKAMADAQEQNQGCSDVVMSEGKRVTPVPEFPVFLTDATATAEQCWDKIVFTFRPTGSDTPPSYEAEYLKPPFTEGPNGAPVSDVESLGTAFLVITFKPASSIDHTDPNKPIQMYRGNLRLTLNGMHHTGIVRKLIDGDGTVSWIVGLDEKRPFTIDAANNPPRVVVYIAR